MTGRDHQAEAARIAAIARYLWAGLGLSIFPIHHPWSPAQPWVPDWVDEKHAGKRPAVKWSRYQSERPTEADIVAWFESGQLHNIGLPTGQLNRVLVVESDSEAGLEWMLEKLPATPARVVTSADYRQHWLYRWDAERPVGNTARLAVSGGLEIDVRGQGGYVLAPGSRHRHGAVYARREGTEPWTPALLSELPTLPADLQLKADLPPAVPSVERFFGSTDDKYKRAEGWMSHRDPAVSGQGGDAWTFVTAANLTRDFDLPDHMAWALLCDWNRRCQPPWGERELREKFENAKKYGKSVAGAKLGDRDQSPAITLRYAHDESLAPAAGGTGAGGDHPAAAPVGTEPPAPGTGSVLDDLVEMHKVEREHLQFLIFPWMLRREVTLFAGDGGTGKSFASAAITANVTAGASIPGLHVEDECAGGRVLFFSAEDHINSILLPRLQNAGADLTKIRAFPMHRHGFVFDLEHLAKLDQYLEAYKPVLLVIDPIVSFLPLGVDMKDANHIRAVMDQLNFLAVKHDCAVLVVAHLSKNGAIYGSVDFRNRSRSVLKVFPNPENDAQMVVSHEKSNYSALHPAIGYYLHQQDPQDRQSTVLRWVTPRRAWSAKELEDAQAHGYDREALLEAERILIEELQSGESVPVPVINAVARDCGIDKNLLGVARRRLGILLHKDWKGGDEVWVLQMPRDNAPVTAQPPEMPL